MVNKLVAALALLSFCGHCAAQQGSANKANSKALTDAAWARAGCGSDDTRFDVKLDKTQRPTPQPESGMAMVYVFEDDRILGSFPTTRVGLDGKWTGGNVPDSYFFFSVQPGKHRLCSNWQGNSKVGAALDFTAEAGKIYYFRAVLKSYGGDVLKLQPEVDAEAQFLIASHYLSASKVKGEED